jgi:signal peptidase II
VPQQRNTRFQLLLFVVSLAVVAADRVSKLLIQHSMTAMDSISVFPGWLRIIHTENPGGAFGVLAEDNTLLRTVVLIGVSAVVLVFVLRALWSHSSSFDALVTRLGLALILGGAIGNLYDRVVRGTVTDFIEVYHGSWSFPAFNVADSAITIGAILLLIDLVRPRRKAVEEQAGFAHK